MSDKEPFTRPILNPQRNLRYIQALGLSEDIQTKIGALLVEDEGLQGKVDMLRRLSLMFRGKSHYAEIFFSLLRDDNLRVLLSDTHIQIREFIELGLLPTPTLWQCLLAGKLADLRTEQDRIGSGGFDKESQLHRELEYSRYMIGAEGLRAKYPINPFLNNDKYTLRPSMAELEKEIEAVARDNIEIRKFIEEEARKGKVVVLFNSRYGTYYVGDVLKEYLIGNPNTACADIRVSSKAFDSEYDFDKYSAPLFISGGKGSVERLLAEEHKTVIVVDGTMDKGKKGRQRFPASMTKIHHDFIQTGNYRAHFWIPGKGLIDPEKVDIGSWGYHLSTPSGNIDTKHRDIIFVRATGISTGEFDDPDVWMERTSLIFGVGGLEVGEYFDFTINTVIERIGKAMSKVEST